MVIDRAIQTELNGLIHWGDADWISRYEFALKIAESFNLKKDLIEPIKTAELKQTAMRPLKGGLSTIYAEKILNPKNAKIRTINIYLIMKLKDKVMFITGGSRGIGLAIGKRAAKDGAKVVLAAKTAEPHPKLPGTIYTAAKEIEEEGGVALPCVLDVRDEQNVKEVVNEAVSHFGAIDICVNNASAISLTSTVDTDMKRYDLMHQINGRGTYLAVSYTHLTLPTKA